MFVFISCVQKEFKLGGSLSRTKKGVLVESRDRIPTKLKAKYSYLHPRIFPEQRVKSSITKKVIRTETVPEREIIIPRVPSPRAGTSVSFKNPESIRNSSEIQIPQRSTSRKGKAWVKPPIVKEVILLSKLSEEDVSENEYVGPLHKVEFFYVKKDLLLSKKTE